MMWHVILHLITVLYLVYVSEIYTIQGNQKSSVHFFKEQKKTLHIMCNLYLVFKVIAIGIQHLLPMCLQLFNPLVVKVGGFRHKEVHESLAQVCFIGEGFSTKMITQGVEEVVIGWRKVR